MRIELELNRYFKTTRCFTSWSLVYRNAAAPSPVNLHVLNPNLFLFVSYYHTHTHTQARISQFEDECLNPVWWSYSALSPHHSFTGNNFTVTLCKFLKKRVSLRVRWLAGWFYFVVITGWSGLIFFSVSDTFRTLLLTSDAIRWATCLLLQGVHKSHITCSWGMCPA